MAKKRTKGAKRLASAVPPSGEWRGLVVSAQNIFFTQINLTFADGLVTGKAVYELKKKRRGSVEGEYRGNRVVLRLTTYEEATFKGRVSAEAGKSKLTGQLRGSGAFDRASLTAYHIDEAQQAAGMWDGGAFANF